MDKELKILSGLTKRFPNWKFFRVLVTRIILPFYKRKQREICISEINGVKMHLDPKEYIDASLLFLPQMYDAKELDTLQELVKENWMILDVGAHIGFYSLTLARWVPKGRVLSIEADPGNAYRFHQNLNLNPAIQNVQLLVNGVSDKEETLSLGISTTGNTSGNSFLSASTTRVNVICKPLLELLQSSQMSHIDLMKMDIEGFEFRVLHQFFDSSQKSMHPRWILIEDNPTLRQEGSLSTLLMDYGYILHKDLGLNYLYRLG